MDRKDGKWPPLAPTKNKREEAKMAPFNPPKADIATATGTVILSGPSVLSPKVTATALESKIWGTDRTVK